MMLEITAHCPLATALADRMRAERDHLTRSWLERISERVALDPNRVFPTDDLLDHMPLLIDGIADYLQDPALVVGSDAAVVGKAMELGALRHAQQFDEYELLKEYEIFGGILFSFLVRAAEQLEEPCTRGELLVCAHRLFRAISLIEQATVTHFLRLSRERTAEREERLRSFNRALTHELKNQIGAAMGAAQVLELEELQEDHRTRLMSIVIRNVGYMRDVLDNLVELTRLDSDTRQHRHVFLPQAAREVVRQLRESARRADVQVRLGELPRTEVNAAAVELALTNYISNAIKYADASKPARRVDVLGYVREDDDEHPCELVVEVRDNGLGVPESQRARLFERYFRAHETAEAAEGTGLGLSIVKDAIEALDGEVWADFTPDGSVFAFALPCRRAADADALRADTPTPAGS
jgi:signal transduction histidine kinase